MSAAQEADGEEDRAFVLYQSAAEDFKVRDFEAGVEKLETAYGLFPKAIILIKLAEGLEHLGRIEEAQEAFAQVEPEDEEMAARVEASLRRLSVQLARPVSVSILTGDVRGARVVLDGVDIGREAPTVVEMPRGIHLLQLVKPGYDVFVIDQFEVTGRGTIVLDVTLVPERHPVMVELGGQAVEDVTVSLGGKSVDLTLDPETGDATLLAPVGVHEVTCVGSGRSVTRSVTVEAGQVSEVSCVASRDDGVWVVGLITAGGTLFVGGAALLTWHLIDLETAREEDATMEPAIPRRDIIGPVLMGAGVATGLLSLLFLSEDTPEDGARIQPAWTPVPGGGLWGVAGRF